MVEDQGNAEQSLLLADCGRRFGHAAISISTPYSAWSHGPTHRQQLGHLLDHGRAADLNAADNVFTTLLRGKIPAGIVQETEINTAISRSLNACENWADLLETARIPTLRYIVSNTTEAGIEFAEEPMPAPLTAAAPKTFPAKLTCWLYERFTRLGRSTNLGPPDGNAVC